VAFVLRHKLFSLTSRAFVIDRKVPWSRPARRESIDSGLQNAAAARRIDVDDAHDRRTSFILVGMQSLDGLFAGCKIAVHT
jgi:hypothetical protein